MSARETGRPWSALAWALTPLALGVVIGAVLWWRDPGARLVLRTSLPWAVVLTGLVLSAALVGWIVLRRRASTRVARARQQEAQRAASEHQRFVQRLDHELKNPLAAISLGLSHLSQTGLEPAEQQRVGESVQAQVRRLARLVAELRRLNDLSPQMLEYEAVDVGEVAQEAVLSVQELPQLEGRAIGVALRPQPWPLGPVRADRDLLVLAVYNVVVNAAKYSDAQRPIDVAVHGDRGTVTIEVSDSGIGVPESDVAGIWEELARGSNARHVSGSGLGLPMVRSVVELHGGTVEAASQEGVGTRVVLTLPRG